VNFTFKPGFWEMYVHTLAEGFRNPVTFVLHAVFPLLGLVILALTVITGEFPSRASVIAVALCFGIVPFYTFVLIGIIRLHNRLFRMEYSYTFSDACISFETEYFRTDFKWAAITGARETRTGMSVYMDSMAAIFLPASALSDPAKLLSLRALLRGRLGDKAKLRA
jgi:hypothetical protein